MTVLSATHFQPSRYQALPIWFWALPFLMCAEVLLATVWLKATQNEKNLWRYGAAWGSHFAVFFFLFALSGSALDPQVAWADVLVTGVLGGLLSGIVLAVQRKGRLLSTSPGELQ